LQKLLEQFCMPRLLFAEKLLSDEARAAQLSLRETR
jgi:hypothetical protein